MFAFYTESIAPDQSKVVILFAKIMEPLFVKI